jgi:hypothetical protein
MADGVNTGRYLTADDVVRLTAHHFGVGVAELTGPSRCYPVLRYRQAGMVAARRLTSASWPAIARAFGRSDHTTAMNAARRDATDIALHRYVNELVNVIRNGNSAAAGGEWIIGIACVCGWASRLQVGREATSTEVFAAYQSLQRAERDHRHIDLGAAS